MKGTYYKTPIDFKALIEKRDLSKTTLETSVDQQLFLLATTAWGECKFDFLYKLNLTDNSITAILGNITLINKIIKFECYEVS